MDLTTLTNVKAYLGITVTTYDSLLSTLITAVSAQVESFCGRTFLYDAQNPTIDYFDTDRETELFLRNYPVATLSSVKYQTGTWDNIIWATYPASGYLLDSEIGSLIFACPLPKIRRYLQVTYLAGYGDDVTDLPADLVQIVNELVALSYNNKETQGISSMSTEGQSVTFSSKSIPEEYRTRLQTYIKVKL